MKWMNEIREINTFEGPCELVPYPYCGLPVNVTLHWRLNILVRTWGNAALFESHHI